VFRLGVIPSGAAFQAEGGISAHEIREQESITLPDRQSKLKDCNGTDADRLVTRIARMGHLKK